MLADEEIIAQFPIHSWSFFNQKDTPLLDKRDEKPSFRCIFRNRLMIVVLLVHHEKLANFSCNLIIAHCYPHFHPLKFKKQANGFDAYERITSSDYSLPSRMKQRSIPVLLGPLTTSISWKKSLIRAHLITFCIPIVNDNIKHNSRAVFAQSTLQY
jgi:hypothetical protein